MIFIFNILCKKCHKKSVKLCFMNELSSYQFLKYINFINMFSKKKIGRKDSDCQTEWWYPSFFIRVFTWLMGFCLFICTKHGESWYSYHLKCFNRSKLFCTNIWEFNEKKSIFAIYCIQLLFSRHSNSFVLCHCISINHSGFKNFKQNNSIWILSYSLKVWRFQHVRKSINNYLQAFIFNIKHFTTCYKLKYNLSIKYSIDKYFKWT